MRWLVVCLAQLPFPALAQDKAQTLADLQAELAKLSADFNGLKAELVQSGAASNGSAGGDALQRMDAIEAALTRITAKTEEIELKVNRVVSDGTNRIGDIEFRLCEQTEGCDPSNIPETPVLGGDTAAAPATTAPAAGTDTAPAADAPELAMGEKNDFDRAKGVLGQGDFRTAADLFATFAQAYPGSPLGQEAAMMRGEALSQLGETANAARAYLEAFSGTPNGPRAGDALVKLGKALGDLGQTPEACVTLSEVSTRFPDSQAASEAQGVIAGLGCQ